MSKFGKLLLSTATLLAIGLLLLGAGGEAVGQKDKKKEAPKVESDAGTLPVPGLKMVIKTMADGKIVATATTDNNGNFVFEKLLPGKYLLDIQPSTKAPINTSRSNIRHLKRMMNEIEVHDISVEFGKGAQPFAPILIEITTNPGRIFGRVGPHVQKGYDTKSK